MTHRIIVRSITHWHEHEIHDRISEILGYDTWSLGTATARQKSHSLEMTLWDLAIDFPTEQDYDRCKGAIAAARAMTPD